MNKNEFLDGITMSILEKLSTGVLPWRRPWKTGIPANFISKRSYNGINFISLLLNDYPSPYYLTYLQCKENGGSINKGSKGCPIVFWKVMEYPLENDEIDWKPFIRYSYVFNLSQTSLYQEDLSVTITSCEEILLNMKAKPMIKHNIHACYYSPSEDYISIPVISDFNTKEEYYSALFHELIHWTGHPSRLNRKASGRYGSEDYAYEELIAELGAAYLCSLCGISNETLENHASYIDGWIKLLKTDNITIMKAALEAKNAVKYIFDFNDRIS